MEACRKCRRELVKEDGSLKAHLMLFHGVESNVRGLELKPSKPLNISGRTISQIVQEAELTYLYRYLIQEAKEHNGDCKCAICFDKYINAAVERSNELVRQIETI